MAKIGGGDPITRLENFLTEFTWNIHPTNMMNGLNKIRGREKPKKRSGTSVRAIVKTQLETVEVERA